jgi:peptidoglycan/LPS O-acetylase OafA/YrhL
LGGGIFAILGKSSFKILTGTEDVSVQCLVNKAFGISSFIPTGYPNCAFQGNAPLVTTAAEMGLYLIFIPISILLLKGYYKATAILIALIWFSGNLLIAIFHESTYLLQWWTHASSINYLLPWFLGASLAFKFKKIYSNFRKVLNILFILLPMAFIFVFFITTNNFPDLYVRQLCLIIYSILFYLLIKLLVLVRQLGFIANFLGGISYILYAVHAPVSIFMISKELSFVNILITNLLLSILLNIVFESPFRNLGRRISQKF